MKKTYYIYLTLTLLITISGVRFGATAQTPLAISDTSLVLKAGIRDGEILVKVIPRTKEVWYFATRSGINFSYARLEKGEWGTFIPFPEQPTLPGTPQRFDEEGSDYALAMKHSLHEQEFIPNSQSFKDIHAVNDAFSSHFFFYFLMSCYDPELSELSGLQLQIPSVMAGKIRLRAEVQGNIRYTAELLLNTSELLNSVQGPVLQAEPGDQKVEFTWNHELNGRHIAAYQLSRSENGTDFSPIGAPIIYNASSAEGKLGMIGATDSLPENYKDYWYKLSGYDIFGYPTNDQPAISVKGSDQTPPARPTHLGVKQTSPTHVMLSWQHQAGDDFSGYQVVGSTAELGAYNKLHDNLLPADQTYFQHTLTKGFFKYYRIMAVDTSYNASVSDIAYLVEVDTVPPLVPVIISATADSSGLIRVEWEPSRANDIKGYRVFKAFHPSHGFHPITPMPLSQTTYTDTISQRLEKKIYYKVVALDTHYNHSQPSAYKVANIPDLIPPTPPLLYNGKLNTDKLPEISWRPSSSSDVESYAVLRSVDTDSLYTKKFYLESAARSFTDDGFGDLGVKYALYEVSAIDSSGNESIASNPRRIFGPQSSKARVSKVESGVYNGNEIVVSWPEENREMGGAVLIYRADEPYEFRLIGRSDMENTYADTRVEKNKTYFYKIGVVDQTGNRWALSKSIQVTAVR